MKLKMTINKIKCVDNITIELPVDKGLYAITGENGSGKSTIVTCASSVFFNMSMNEYLGKVEKGAFIDFELDGAKRRWENDGRKWMQSYQGLMHIKGFYEGSLIFGNRFRNTSYSKLKTLNVANVNSLENADEFIRTNLGRILQGDENYYEELLVAKNLAGFDRDVFFYKKSERIINQFYMSTGENLLLSVLNSLHLRILDRASKNKPCIMFLDEIELALHPSSLKRLVNFLGVVANEYNYAIYFSTHSIELISSIKPDNIYYVKRYIDNSIQIINPCYPAYATKFLYDHAGYDRIILVEDDLAKDIVWRIIQDKKMINNQLIHILPCGGYTNVIQLADDVVRNNLLSKNASIMVILDKDVQDKAKRYIVERNIANNIALNFLPIESLEKYLRYNLYLNCDHELFKVLNDYVFLQTSLDKIISIYKTEKNAKEDTSGKILYSLIDTELRNRNKDRKYLVELIVEYLMTHDIQSITKISDFLKRQLK